MFFWQIIRIVQAVGQEADLETGSRKQTWEQGAGLGNRERTRGPEAIV